jgi:hypothetical protein
METKFKLHSYPNDAYLKDVSLEKACELANWVSSTSESDVLTDLSYMLEYLRLNFDLVPKK